VEKITLSLPSSPTTQDPVMREELTRLYNQLKKMVDANNALIDEVNDLKRKVDGS